MSYSEYESDLAAYYEKAIAPDFRDCRAKLSALLREETSLMEIVKLIGADVLPDDQKLVIEAARVVRTGFLQQNAYHASDTYVGLDKQYRMMKTILRLYERAKELLPLGIPVSRLVESGIFDKLVRMKYDIPNEKPELFDDYIREIDSTVDRLVGKGGGDR